MAFPCHRLEARYLRARREPLSRSAKSRRLLDFGGRASPGRVARPLPRFRRAPSSPVGESASPEPDAVQQPALPLPLPADHLLRLLAADQQDAALRLARHHRLRLLLLLELQVLCADALLDAGQLSGRPRTAPVGGSRAAPPLPRHPRHPGPGAAGVLQVHQLRPDKRQRPLHVVRRADPVRHPRHRPARRHLVLHLPHRDLHRRLLPRTDHAHEELLPVRVLRLALPPAGGRSHRPLPADLRRLGEDR